MWFRYSNFWKGSYRGRGGGGVPPPTPTPARSLRSLARGTDHLPPPPIMKTNRHLWVTRTWNIFWLGLEDSDLDSEVMTRTRTRTLMRWLLGLGLGLRGDDSDSDLTIWTRTQHWQSLTTWYTQRQAGTWRNPAVAGIEGGATGAPPPLKFYWLCFFFYPILYQNA